MPTGNVKWFNFKKGYGFISPDDGAADLFVHYTAIVDEDNSFRTLHQDDKVAFEITEGDKGQIAKNVIVTNKAPKPKRTKKKAKNNGSKSDSEESQLVI